MDLEKILFWKRYILVYTARKPYIILGVPDLALIRKKRITVNF